MRSVRLVAALCAWSVLHAGLAVADDETSTPVKGSARIYRGSPVTPPAAEYYSTDIRTGTLVRVNIWGDVAKPGVYFVPVGTTLLDSVSSAGGPAGTASLPKVRLLRNDEETYVDLLAASGRMPISENDMIYIDRSWKAEMPLIMGTISTILSVAAFYLVITNDKK